jgi:hypothetical protein
MASLPQSVIDFLKREEEAKIQKQQEKERKQAEYQIKQAEKERKQVENQIKAKEQQEIQNFLRHRRADFVRIQEEMRNFLEEEKRPKILKNGKTAPRPKHNILSNILRRMGIPKVDEFDESLPKTARRTTPSLARMAALRDFYKNESPEAVALQGEILSTLKREWEAKKAEEKAIEEAAKEAERQRIKARNEEEKRGKEEELARLRVSLRPRVEEDIAKMIKSAYLPSSIPLTGNKVYDEIFAELIQPHIERFQKEKSRKGLQEAYEYISRRQKDGIKHLGQWTGSEITPTEEEILERLKIEINGGSGFESDISKKIFNEYLKASNHSGGRRKTRRARKHRRRLTYRKQ